MGSIKSLSMAAIALSLMALTCTDANSATKLTPCSTLFYKKYPSVANHKAFASSEQIPGLDKHLGLACGGAGPYSTVRQAEAEALAQCKKNAQKYLKNAQCHIVKSE